MEEDRKMLILLRINFGSSNRECQLKVSWCREILSSATWQILPLARVDPGRLKLTFGGTEANRLVEAASKAVTKSTQQIVTRAIQLDAFRLP